MMRCVEDLFLPSRLEARRGLHGMFSVDLYGGRRLPPHEEASPPLAARRMSFLSVADSLLAGPACLLANGSRLALSPRLSSPRRLRVCAWCLRSFVPTASRFLLFLGAYFNTVKARVTQALNFVTYTRAGCLLHLSVSRVCYFVFAAYLAMGPMRSYICVGESSFQCTALSYPLCRKL